MITGATGAFDLRVSDEEDRPEVKAVCVLDRTGKLLGEIQLPGRSKGASDQGLDVVIDDHMLATADIPRLVGDRRVFRDSALALLRATAAELVDLGRDPERIVPAVVDRVEAALPPLARHPTIVGLATEVLRGRVQAYGAFERELDLLDDWNTRLFGPNVVLPREVAARLLEPDDQPVAHVSDRDEGNGPIDVQALYTIVGAAMRVGHGDPVRTLRNVGVIARQLCPFTEAVRLHRMAAEPPSGFGSSDRFGDRARVIASDGDWGGGAGPDDRPRPGRLPDSRPPKPIPGCPGDNVWPPRPPIGEPTKLPPLPIPGSVGCPEWITEFGFRNRERTYATTSIEPPDACVGELVTIRGSGLQFENTQTLVTFAGLASGSQVEARIVGQITDTAITVEVPEGATCGPVQLYSDGSSVVICDVSYELFEGPRMPYWFEGGLPHFRGPIRVEGRQAGADGVVPGCVPADAPILVSWGYCGVVTLVEVQAVKVSDGALAWSDSRQSDLREARFSVPADDPAEAAYNVTVRLTGRCGTAEQTVLVATRRALAAEDFPVQFGPFNFENFHKNQNRPGILRFIPPSLDHLRAAVVATESVVVAGGSDPQLGVTGSRCSYTNCVVPDGPARVIGMDSLQRWLNLDTRNFNGGPAAPRWRNRLESQIPLVSDYMPRARASLFPVLRSNIESVLGGSTWDAYAPFTTMLPIQQRLVYVEAGLLVEELNALLDHHNPSLALATMGAGTHQTLAGAISTGTHGSTWRLPPLGDFVRAIHLVGTNGEQWWLEPSTRPITDAAAMRAAALAGDLGLKPCTRIRYNDALFNAALVSAGCAGIIYAYVIETVPAHRMKSKVCEMTWDEAKDRIRAEFASSSPSTWFLEAITSPSRKAIVSEKRLTTDELTPPPPQPLPLASPPPDPSAIEEAATVTALVAVILAALAAAVAVVALEVAEATVALGLLVAQFPARFWDGDYYDEVAAAAERLGIVGDFLEALADGVAILAPGPDEQEIADALPNLVELLWQLSPLGVDAGQAAIDEIQRVQTLGFEKAPPVAKSFTALAGQPEGPPKETPREAHYNARERIIRSSEYAFRLDAGLSFVDDLLRDVQALRNGDDAFVLSINVRFTGPTRALIGMQQFAPISCHVELFTMAGLDGNTAVDGVVDRLVRLHGGVPHWGQLHPTDLDFRALFGAPTSPSGASKLDSWRSSIATLADGRTTFRHAFATDRGLLP